LWFTTRQTYPYTRFVPDLTDSLSVLVQRSRGGVKFPTGGVGICASARERTTFMGCGQQIRCESEADGTT